MYNIVRTKEEGTKEIADLFGYAFFLSSSKFFGSPSSHIFIMVFLFLKIRFMMAVLLSENPIKNTLNCSIIVMKSITNVTSAVFSLTAQTTTSKLTFRRKISKKDLPRRTGMNRSLARPCFWMQTWFLLPCRCIPEMSQRNHISGRSYRR